MTGFAAAGLILLAPVQCRDCQPTPPVSAAAEARAQRADERRAMVQEQLAGRNIRGARVLEAMRVVPRHAFVPERSGRSAYRDGPVPIGHGQTISQPYIVALMTECAELRGGERVLEIGVGSGYQAAVLAELRCEVYSIEIVPHLAQAARERLAALGYEGVRVRNGDGYDGWAEAGPFDVVLITAAVDHVPPPLLGQLRDGGRLILPLGNPHVGQTLTRVRKEGERTRSEEITEVRFVPMTGRAQGR